MVRTSPTGRLGRLFVWTAAAAVLASCASVAPESAETVLRRADSAMGGKDLRSISFAGSGTGATFGQAYEPGGAWPKITYSSFTRLADYDQGAFREDAARSRAEPTGGGRGAADGHRRAAHHRADARWLCMESRRPGAGGFTA